MSDCRQVCRTPGSSPVEQVDGALRASLWGEAGRLGGIDSADVAAAGDHLVVIVGRGVEYETAVGLRLDPKASRAEPVWTRELPLPTDRPGPNAGLFHTSAIPAEDDGVFLVSGIARVLVDARSGAVVAETEAPVATSEAAVADSELLVCECDPCRAESPLPERRHLAAYDATSLALRWRRPVPEGLFAVGAPTGGACPVRGPAGGEEERTARLWLLASDTVSVVRPSWPISSAAVRVGSVVVASCGGGAGSQLVGLDADSGELLWSADSPPPDPWMFHAPAPAADPVAYPVVAHGDRVVWISQAPAVEARLASTGERLWRVGLVERPDDLAAVGRAQPTALALIDGTAWVGTHDGRVVAVDADTGSVLGERELHGPERGPGPVGIVPIPVRGAAGVIAVTSLGDIYGVSLAN